MNDTLKNAKNKKNDEFYTQYNDIQKEVNAYVGYNENVFKDKTILLPCDDPEWSNFTKFFAANFTRYGIKKLISTSYAIESKKYKDPKWEPSLFESESEIYNPKLTRFRGKIFTLDRDTNKDNKIDIDDLAWDYLDGDGDFRSEEVTSLRDEADIIITNPPFSLFREFLSWIMDGRKQFLIISNKNAITYKEVFPLIKDNKIWLGYTPMSTDLLFTVPNEIGEEFVRNGKEGSNYKKIDGIVYGRSTSVWFTNLDHGRRHEPLMLMTMEENIRFSRHKEIKDLGYQHYDNYDAIEVPFTDAIPSDYDGVMGVPISFLDKYCPEQFEIVGMGEDNGMGYSGGVWNGGSKSCLVNGKAMFKRIFIKRESQ